MMRVIAPFLVLLLAGCAAGSATYDSGRNDGYAVGYNTACEIRATMIEGDWDSAEYARGYAAGVTAGIQACNAERKAR